MDWIEAYLQGSSRLHDVLYLLKKLVPLTTQVITREIEIKNRENTPYESPTLFAKCA
jgi:hypothetical protein